MKDRIVLITPHTISQRTAEETLALGYLTAILRRAGYRVTIIDAWLRGIIRQEIVDLAFEEDNPSIVCLSCYRSNLDQAKEIIESVKIKAKGVPIICGGYGPTFHDAEFLEAGFDVVVRGEAETIFVDLIRTILTKGRLFNIPGISFVVAGKIIRTKRIKGISNLETIPFPARDEMSHVIRRKNPVHICTSRGCNGNCSFCSVIAFNQGVNQKRWRGRPIDNIVTEIQDIYDRFGIDSFKFVDDSFIEPPRDENWIDGFAKAMEKLGLNIRFRTQVRADRLTEPIVRSLKNCGLFAVSVGIENFSNSALLRMRKPARSDDNFRAIELLRKYNVYTQIGLIMFDNLTTMDELIENYNALRRCNWVITKGIFTEMFAAEGTVFTRQLRGANLLVENGSNQNHTYDIRDILVSRAYAMLKSWHKSHALIFDQVIDPITAPKVLSNEGYVSVHKLCSELLRLDTNFFEKTISWVTDKPCCGDAEMVELEIRSATNCYKEIRRKINIIYQREGLIYDGVFNPFLA